MYFSTRAQILIIIRVIFSPTLLNSNSFAADVEQRALSIISGAGAANTIIKPQLQYGELIPIVATVQPPHPSTLPPPSHTAWLPAPAPSSSLHTKYPTLNWSVLLQHVCNEKAAHNS